MLATTDIDELIALGADAVFYSPFTADLDDAVRLLEGGLDVVSTKLVLNVGGIQGETGALLGSPTLTAHPGRPTAREIFSARPSFLASRCLCNVVP